jgi:putative oxidoreductase
MIERERSGEVMAQVLTQGTQSALGSTAKIVNIVLWVLQIGAAGMFLMVGFLKLSGNPQLVALFEAIGIGQWFRYLTGSLEVAGAILLLIPRTSGLAALMLAGVMACAVVTHVFIVGGSPLGATILLVVTGLVAWGRRHRTSSLFSAQKLTSLSLLP